MIELYSATKIQSEDQLREVFRIKLSLKLITEALEPFGAQLILERDRQYGFTKVQILYEPCDELDKETLYMCMPRVLSRMRRSAFEDNCFVFFARPEQVQCRHAGILCAESCWTRPTAWAKL